MSAAAGISHISAPALRRAGWLVDALVCVLLAAAQVGWIYYLTGPQARVYYDTYRDAAYAENILHGRLWQDPSIQGASWWYPPLNPLLVAGMARLTGAEVLDVYGASRFVVNAWLPALVYLLTRAVWGRLAGLLAIPMVFIGSCWWWTHAAAPMPSIQGVILNLIGLACWHRSVTRGGWAWPIITGVVLALGIWHHPVCSIVLAGAIGAHALLDAADRRLRPPNGARAPATGQVADPATEPRAASGLSRRWRSGSSALRPMLVVAGTSAVLAAPVIWHLARMPHINLKPFHYFAMNLFANRYAFYAHMPAIPLLALYGLWHAARPTPGARWLLAYVLVGVAGQVPGYIAKEAELPLPYFVPHEFQWHTQLALGIAAGIGAARLARAAVGRARDPGGPKPVLATLLLLATVAIGVHGAGVLHGQDRTADDVLPAPDIEFIDAHTPLGRQQALLGWLRTHTKLDTVIAADVSTSYFLISGAAGRKSVALPLEHANPAIAAVQRATDVSALLETPSAAALQTVVSRYHAAYLVLTDEPYDRAWERRAALAALSGLECVWVAPDDVARVYRVR